MNEDNCEKAAVDMPIDGTLDLHTFQPREIGTLLPDYFTECRKRGILQVRVIHGKGSGALRKGVIAILDRLSEVESYSSAGVGAGGWGATLVHLQPLGCK